MKHLKSILLIVSIVLCQLLEANKIQDIVIIDSQNIKIIQSSIIGISKKRVTTLLKSSKDRIKYLETKLKKSFSRKEKFKWEKELIREKDKLKIALLEIKTLGEKLKAYAPDIKVLKEVNRILDKQGLKASLEYLESLDIEKVVSDNVEKSKIYLITAKLYALKKKGKEKVREFYKKSFQAHPTYMNAMTYSNYLSKENESDLAINILKSMNDIKDLDEKEEMQYFNNLGNLYMKDNQNSQAMRHYEDALEIADLSDDESLNDIANISINLANLYKKKKKFSSAEKFYKKALTNLRQIKLKDREANASIARGSNALGSLYREVKKIKKSKIYYGQALKLYSILAQSNVDKYKGFFADTYFNIANLFYENRETKKAYKYYYRAFGIYNQLLENNRQTYSPKILSCITKLVSINPSNKLKLEKAHALQNMAGVYSVKDKYTKATKSFLEAQKLYKELEYKDTENLSGLAYAYYKAKKYDIAKKYYEHILKINIKNSGDFLNYYEMSIISNTQVDKKLEVDFVINFKDNKEVFIYYEMFKMIENMAHQKNIELEVWMKKYKNTKFEFDLKPFKKWVKDRVKDERIKKEWKKINVIFSKKNKSNNLK